MEALLYAGGTRQCRVAMDLGLHEGENRCYVCICPPSPAAAEALERILRPDDGDWEGIDEAKKMRLMKRYAINGEQLAAAAGGSGPWSLCGSPSSKLTPTAVIYRACNRCYFA